MFPQRSSSWPKSQLRADWAEKLLAGDIPMGIAGGEDDGEDEQPSVGLVDDAM